MSDKIEIDRDYLPTLLRAVEGYKLFCDMQQDAVEEQFGCVENQYVAKEYDNIFGLSIQLNDQLEE